jgi:hypothetical protein
MFFSKVLAYFSSVDFWKEEELAGKACSTSSKSRLAFKTSKRYVAVICSSG